MKSSHSTKHDAKTSSNKINSEIPSFYKLENVFMKHYAPNHMLAPKENIYHLSILSLTGKSQKRDISQSIVYGIYSKFIQVIYTLNTNCAKYHDPSSSGYPDISFTMSLMAKLPKSKKEHNSVKYSQNFTKVNQVICIMFPNCMPDIMNLAQAILQIFCWQDCFTIQNAKFGKGR